MTKDSLMRSPTYINRNLLHSEINSQYPIPLLEFDNEEFSLKIRMNFLLNRVYRDLGKLGGLDPPKQFSLKFCRMLSKDFCGGYSQ